LGFSDDLLRHGIEREVFLAQLADNALQLLRTGKGKPDLSSLLSADDVSRLAPRLFGFCKENLVLSSC
jgi:hypothetical protein